MGDRVAQTFDLSNGRIARNRMVLPSCSLKNPFREDQPQMADKTSLFFICVISNLWLDYPAASLRLCARIPSPDFRL